jgi:hypothetical protein
MEAFHTSILAEYHYPFRNALAFASEISAAINLLFFQKIGQKFSGAVRDASEIRCR